VTPERIVWKVLLSSAASEDLRSIGAWTAEHFGSMQSEHYAQIISDALQELRAGPALTGVKKYNALGSGLFMLHIARHRRKARHILVFRIGRVDEQDVIEILRILHDAMDPARHMPPEV
jgi:toxin ParE1/3/4